MQLYTYWRSSAAYRVRIALQLKGLSYQSHYVHLLRDGGEQHQAAYRGLNPQELLPTLVLGDGQRLSQSLAIIEYLEEVHPAPALLPADPAGRGRVRALAQLIACDIHPLNNLRVLQHLSREFGADEAQQSAWHRHWMALGFAALENLVAQQPERGRFCYGETPGLADICLVPQLYNARRYALDLNPYPTLRRIDRACAALAPFRRAAPEAQGDAP